jgi:hypothetical protein
MRYLSDCPDIIKSRGSSVGIETNYGLGDRMIGVRNLAGVGNFSLHNCILTGSGAHQYSYPMSTRGSFPGSKAAAV